MNHRIHTPLVLSLVALLLVGLAAQAAPAPRISQADIIKQSAPGDWRRLDPEQTLVMEINGQQVILELAPRFAPQHAANIRTLAREGYYTGSAVVRVQDNYVTQWADPADDEKEKEKLKPLGTARASLPAEFAIPFKGLPIARFTDPDGWALVSGFVGGMPVALWHGRCSTQRQARQQQRHQPVRHQWPGTARAGPQHHGGGPCGQGHGGAVIPTARTRSHGFL
jgi:hypothetical protein